MTLTFATYNIQFGLGQDGKFDTLRIADAVAEADIICFQEVVQGWPRDEFEDQAATLAGRLNYFYVFGSTFDVDGSTRDDSGKVVNRRRTFGNMVASRWPISASRTLHLRKKPSPGVFDLQRCAVEAIVELPGGPIRVYSTHLGHQAPSHRMPQVEALREYIFRAPYEGAPIDAPHPLPPESAFDWTEGLAFAPAPRSAILAGDFNCRPTSEEYAYLCGEPHHKRGRTRHYDQLVDTWVASGHEEEGVSTLYNRDGDFKIDHVLVTDDLAPKVKGSRVGTDIDVSDHYPVFVEFDL
ncbi:endonuclease/exonuclease/phosphatase family protein [Nisaea sediminum]|uniref:endonuclease/exonuclease/phosphatase family protein n=1 Tax=Nisaea sediminum TaxID=2775867 RepID=UPI001865ADFC|nr:endonuclease/exonuclease/phosphatase family protein [Nisaea sediminum]